MIPESESPENPKASTRNKRSSQQKASDALFIERQVLRGTSYREIAELLSAERPYSISYVQVAHDIKRMKREWMAETRDLIAIEQEKLLRKLDLAETELWEAWERSKGDSLQRLMAKTEGTGPSDDAGSRKTDTVRKVSRDGDPRFMAGILAVHDRRAKLLGLDAAQKHEVTGTNGGPVAVAAITEQQADGLLRRHFERMMTANPNYPN